MSQEPPGASGLAPLLKTTGPLSEDSRERLFTALYAELHRLAEKHVRRNAGIAISPTTLLHEAYLGVARGEADFPDRARFLAYASRVMRNLIIDFARQRRAEKHGGGFHFTQLQEELIEPHSSAAGDADRLVKLSDALDELAQVDGALAELVDLRYFCGLSVAEIAALRGVSPRTVERDWQKARTALYDALCDFPPP
jgi:RNA polymerase sigma factor (TIGR02999 family)